MSIDLGIDLGTTKIIIYRAGKGVVLEEPSVVACNTRTSEVVAVGHEALRMMGRAPAYIQIECPVREGVISNHEFTEFLIKEFVRKVAGSFLIRPRIAICIPSAITRVEARAVVEAAVSAGARKVFLIDEPIAAAIGAGIDVTKPVGRMMVDLGGGTTDIAVISMGGIIVSASLKIAGNSFDEAIVRYIENTYKLAIGTTVGEQLKKEIGCVFEPQPDIKTTIRGRNLITGIPEEISVSQTEICDVLRPLADEIVTGVKQVLGRTPPELSGDILTEGILMTGGTAQLRGLSDLIEHATGIATTVARDPVSCVGIGTGKCFSLIGELKEGFELASGGGRS
jgi:rod shape-determining protein MreB